MSTHRTVPRCVNSRFRKSSVLQRVALPLRKPSPPRALNRAVVFRVCLYPPYQRSCHKHSGPAKPRTQGLAKVIESASIGSCPDWWLASIIYLNRAVIKRCCPEAHHDAGTHLHSRCRCHRSCRRSRELTPKSRFSAGSDQIFALPYPFMSTLQ